MKPKSAAYATSGPLLLLTDSPVKKPFYTCYNYYVYMTDDPRKNCLSCWRTKLEYVTPTAENEVASSGGFVKGVVTYMVLDNLVVYYFKHHSAE